MESKRCLACGCVFHPRPQNPRQSYCPATPCQRERRRRWQRAKRRKDTDYRENQRSAQQAWLRRHPDYWKQYRATHPESVEKNRLRQRQRRRVAAAGRVAKMDVSAPDFPLASGTYRLIRLAPGRVAKMDAWMIKISLLSKR